MNEKGELGTAAGEGGVATAAVAYDKEVCALELYALVRPCGVEGGRDGAFTPCADLIPSLRRRWNRNPAPRSWSG
jgi:hypothetical protein